MSAAAARDSSTEKRAVKKKKKSLPSLALPALVEEVAAAAAESRPGSGLPKGRDPNKKEVEEIFVSKLAKIFTKYSFIDILTDKKDQTLTIF